MRLKGNGKDCSNPQEVKEIIHEFLVGSKEHAIQLMNTHIQRCYPCWIKLQRITSILDLFNNQEGKEPCAVFLERMATQFEEKEEGPSIQQLHHLVPHTYSGTTQHFSESLQEELRLASDLYIALENTPVAEVKKEPRNARMWLAAAAVAAMFFITLQTANRETQKSLLPNLADGSPITSEPANYFNSFPMQQASSVLGDRTSKVSFSLPMDQVLSNLYRMDFQPNEPSPLFFSVSMNK